MLDAPVLRQARPATAAEHRALDEPVKEPTEEVQAALADTIHWLASLATAIYSTKADTNMPLLQMLSMRWEALSREQRQEWQTRKSNLREIAAQFPQAKLLAQDRDSGKRKFEDMSRADQQLLEYFDTDKLHKRRRQNLAHKSPAFRTHMSFASAAAEHAAASSGASAAAEPARAANYKCPETVKDCFDKAASESPPPQRGTGAAEEHAPQ